MTRRTVRTTAAVERKDPSLPRFVVVADDDVSAWALDGTTVVEVTLNGTDLGRRTLKRWPERNGWFFDLPEAHCQHAGVDTGDAVRAELTRADTSPPEELRQVIASDDEAAERWEKMSPARRRQIAEHVRSAKRPETRRRRARKALTS